MRNQDQWHKKIGFVALRALMEDGKPDYIELVWVEYADAEAADCLKLFHKEGFDICKVDEVVQVAGDDNYTHFMLTDGQRFTASRTLKDYEAFLDKLGFFRIHQSTIVNLRHVRGYRKPKHKGLGGKVKLSNGEWLAVSRDRKQRFLKRFESPPPDSLPLGGGG